MSESASFDLIVIGAGPGGYVAAIRAAQLGLRVACIEKQYLGGVCLNVGCIPSKALLDSTEKYYAAKNTLSHHGIKVGQLDFDLPVMLARKDKVVKTLTDGVGLLFRRNKIESIRGAGRLLNATTVEVKDAASTRTITAPKILIATGSAAIQLPGLPFDATHIVSSTEALCFNPVPKKLIVVGAGYIGLEIGSVWNRLGAEVLVLEFLDRIIPPMDGEMTTALQRILEKQGLKFKFNTAAQSAKVVDGKVQVTWSSGDQTGVEEADRVLVATGRKPYTENLGLAEIGVEMDKRGFIKVDKHFATSVPGVYAIGDVIGGAMLAHKAEEEGVAAVEIIAGKAGHVNYHAVPGVVYTHPELAQVGYTEDDAKAAGHEIKVGKFPLLANGRARAMDEIEGMVKIIADAKTDRVLGVHILAAHASDMIAEAALAVEFAASAEDIARAVHAHPTLPEAMKEAALAVGKRAIHI